MRVSIFLFFCGCSAFLQSVSAAVVQVILDSSPWCQCGACLFGIRAYGECSCTVRLWHFILVVHIHSLAIIVVLLSENAL